MTMDFHNWIVDYKSNMSYEEIELDVFTHFVCWLLRNFLFFTPFGAAFTLTRGAMYKGWRKAGAAVSEEFHMIYKK